MSVSLSKHCFWTSFVRTSFKCYPKAFDVGSSPYPHFYYEGVLNRNLKALTAEIKLSGEVPSEEITLITQKIDVLGDEVLFAIQHPFEVIDPEDVRHLPYEFLFGEGWRKLRERNLAQSNRNTEK